MQGTDSRNLTIFVRDILLAECKHLVYMHNYVVVHLQKPDITANLTSNKCRGLEGIVEPDNDDRTHTKG